MKGLVREWKKTFQNRFVQERNGTQQKKVIYFLDTTALTYYAGPLYICFLMDQFDKKVIAPEEDSVLVTDEQTMQEIQTLSMRAEKNRREKKSGATETDKLYLGYSEFIARNVEVISREKAMHFLQEENSLRKTLGGVSVAEEGEGVAHVIGSLLYTTERYNESPILITADENAEKIAKRNGIKVMRIQ